MGFKKPKNKGKANSLVTRNFAAKKLQVNFDQFRRLCILKGIFPRAIPAGAGKLRGKTAYLKKDIKLLKNDPILDVMRQRKIYNRRLLRRIRRNEPAAAESVRKTFPVMRLDHIIRERYPTFRDALKGMQDAITMLSVVAKHSPTGEIPEKKIVEAQRLVREWEAYVVETRALTKAFISVRGFYFQAYVGGVNVTWIVPHNFGLVENNVDYNVIVPFIDVYITLASFVNYKLYADKDFLYPPQINEAMVKAGEYLAAVALHKKETLVPEIAAAKKADAEKTELEIESEKRIAQLTQKMSSIAKSDLEAQKANPSADMDALNDEDGPDDEDADIEEEEDDDEEKKEEKEESEKVNENEEENKQNNNNNDDDDKEIKLNFGKLFERCKFYLGREVPRRPLELLIKGNGGQVAWDTPFAPYARDDATITHEVMDRNAVAGRVAGRDYVQPQWVFDCVNEHILIPVDEYAPGRQPPPHLSPFVRESENDYTPERRVELAKLHEFLDVQKQREDSSAASAAEYAKQPKYPYVDEEEVMFGKKKGEEDEEMEEEEEEEIEEVEEDELDEDDKTDLYEAELEAERKGLSAKEAQAFIAKEANKKIAEKKKKAAIEEKREMRNEKDRTIGMLSSKKRRKALREDRVKAIKDKKVKKLMKKRNPEIDKKGLAKGQRTVPRKI